MNSETVEMGQGEPLTAFSRVPQHRRYRPFEQRPGKANAIVPRPSVMPPCSETSKWARFDRPGYVCCKSVQPSISCRPASLRRNVKKDQGTHAPLQIT